MFDLASGLDKADRNSHDDEEEDVKCIGGATDFVLFRLRPHTFRCLLYIASLQPC